MNKFADTLGNMATVLASNKYLSAIKNAFMAIIPFTIAGSVAVLFGSVIFGPTMLGGVKGLEFLTQLSPLFNAINYASMNFMAVMVSFFIGYYLAKELDVKDPVFAGFVSLASFIILIPTQVIPDASLPEVIAKNVVSVDVTGSKGLFVAIITGLVVIKFYSVLMKIDKLQIKLHESVPENVAKSFTALLPTLIVLFAVGIFGYTFSKTTGLYFSEVVYKVLQTPLEAMMQHPLGIIFAALFAHVLWVLGIHGASLTTGILGPMMLSALATNTELVQQGLEPTEIVTRPFWNMYATMGGSGCTLALLIAVLIFSKRDDEKAIAKLSVGPGMFGINEPVIFGMPIVFNPIYAIPFILTPVVCCAIGYLSIATGFAAKIYVNIPWSLPPVVNGFVATGGDLNTAITQLFCIFISVLIYIPFVRMSNKQYSKQQTEK